MRGRIAMWGVPAAAAASMGALPLRVLASCASPPPSGQTCDDTVALDMPLPPWLPLSILAAFIVVAVVVTMVRTRTSRR